jgi:hypothetical protein
VIQEDDADIEPGQQVDQVGIDHRQLVDFGLVLGVERHQFLIH